MILIYNTAIHLYLLAIRVASLFNAKAKLWLDGRRDLFQRMEEALEDHQHQGRRDHIAWFHCASLGEFEQGRPVIEKFHTRFPDHTILLTFFSPSGYEIRKNYQEAGYIFYLPIDTRQNAERFVALFQPEMVFFIKYDYWYNYLRILHKYNIPTYFISAVFRPGQYFFKWYGGWFRSWIKTVKWFFLQDDESAELLQSIGVTSFTVTGDTRFDRVDKVVRHAHEEPLIDRFRGNSMILLAGSSWPEDEELLISSMKKMDENVKFIIAPHETDPDRITSLISRLPFPSVRYTGMNSENVDECRVLVIDCIGILVHLYRYATVAFIGGGFGAGIHNILEAAAFGVPVLFGPNYSKFREARDLIALRGAFSISNNEQFEVTVNRLLKKSDEYTLASVVCSNYVQEKKGATNKILDKIDG